MIIEKKVWPQYFQAILDDKKTFELRLSDFECSEGDQLLLKEWNPESKNYTGRELLVDVTYVIHTKDQKFWTKEEIEKHGFQVINFRKLQNK